MYDECFNSGFQTNEMQQCHMKHYIATFWLVYHVL